MPNALSFLVDPEYWKSVRKTAPNSLANLSKGITAGFLGAPVDIANMALQPIGFGSERPVGGSNQLGRLMGADTNSVPYMVGDMLPTGPDDLARGLPLMAGIFAGKSAKTADLAKLMKAEELRAAGVPDSKIWGETGWTFGFPDKKPRFEIPDDAATAQFTHLSPNPERIAERAVEHPALFSAYPDTTRISQLGLREQNATGSMDSLGGHLIARAPDAGELKSVGIHELQHAIQQREGFARGGSPETSAGVGMTQDNTMDYARKAYEEANTLAKNLDLLNPEDALLNDLLGSGVRRWDELPQREKLGWIDQGRNLAYRRLAGEAEARLTQARMNLTPEQRLAQYPVSQFDVPVENQIVRYGDDVARSIPNKTEFEIAHEVAQRNAALPLEQGGLGLPANNTAMDRAMAMSATGDDVSLIGGPSSGLRDAYIIGKKTRDVNPDLNTWAYTDEYKDTLGSFPWEENRTPAWEAFYRAGKLNREEPVMAIGSRYGEIPERGTSFNYRDQINERGVSMADVQNSNAAEWGDPISKTIIEGYGRPKINVGGYLIDDVGADGEPLLVAAKRLTGDYVIDSGKKRSRFAAFDPFQRNSANILAGGAAGGIGINALYDLMNQEEYQ